MSNQLRQPSVGQQDTDQLNRVEEFKFEPIKGYPMLHWYGKRPFTSTHFYPAQHKETYGLEVEGWRNKIYWGDNLQVMSHLLKQYREQIKLVYIDPPYDSKAEYKKKISIAGIEVTNDRTAFEEKQYTDIWTNDEYLQFMYERLIIIKELLSNDGSVILHCDWHKNSHLRCILDEIFGPSNIVNEIIWHYKTFQGQTRSYFARKHDTLLFYSKSKTFTFNQLYDTDVEDAIDNKRWANYIDEQGRIYARNMPSHDSRFIRYLNKWKKEYGREPEDDDVIYVVQGQPIDSVWELKGLDPKSGEKVDYPTQKPESLLERVILAASNPNDLVLDCFMGSGTTQAVAMKLGRRFIGADINLGAVHTTTKRLLALAKQLEKNQHRLDLRTDTSNQHTTSIYTGFEVYNVNHYDIFRNPIEAKEILLQTLEVNRLQAGQLFDGEKDGRMVKVLPVNRIATRQDLNELINGFDYRAFDRRRAENPNKPVEKVTLVCMGHEPGLAAHLKQEVSPYVLDVEVVDILRDKQDIQFKRDSEARITVKGEYLVIERFYPMNLLSKLSLQAESVSDWRELVESVMIDWNYDGAVLQPTVVDIPPENELVAERYAIPEDAGTIRVKITDLLSESLEQEVRYG